MLKIVLVGLNHKTAPVELRERLAFSKEETDNAIEMLKNDPAFKEVLLLSTCNRVEILVAAPNKDDGINAAKSFVSDFKGIPYAQFEHALYVLTGDEAVKHVFRVASSLDSMMVGEPQILGQIKESYRMATQKKSSGVVLNRMLHRAFFVAKRIRNETGIGDNAVSISYAAIELGKKIFGTLEGKKVLLVGAGEMAELAVEHLIRNKVETIFVANRTFERGLELAKKFNGQALRFEEIIESLKFIDIIISSTGSTDFVITRDKVKKTMKSRRNQPIFFIDIAVPRDIDPAINKLSNSYVYDIDDLKGVIDENIDERNREAIKGERIVDEAVIHFRQWFDNLSTVPTIIALRTKLQAMASAEVEKTLSSLKHISEKDSQAIHRMTEALINKIMHDPTLYLKRNGCQKDKSLYLDVARKLFNLDE